MIWRSVKIIIVALKILHVLLRLFYDEPKCTVTCGLERVLSFTLLSPFNSLSLSVFQSPDQLAQIEQEAIRLSEEIKAEYWAVSAKSGESQTHINRNKSPIPTSNSQHPYMLFIFCVIFFFSLNSFLCLFIAPGDGIRDFFFRVASLTFEANVLSELEKSGSKHAGDIISK